MAPKVTVLMTVYNGESYLKECIDSVLNQTFKDFEFLVIDDCSNDSSMHILRSYSDNRLRIIKNDTNLGQVKSLNIGLDLTKGEYIARIDQDDMMARDRLKIQTNFLDRRQDVSVVGTWGEVMDEEGKIFTRSNFSTRNEEIVGSVLFGGYFLMHPSVLFRRKAIIDAGRYNENFSYTEDYELWTRLLLKRHKLANIPFYLTKFRYHKKSSSRQFSETQITNVRISVSNFVRGIIGENYISELDCLCDILIDAGLINKMFWSKGYDVDKYIPLLDTVLKRTIDYFGFKDKEAYLIKRVFCNNLLNFAYGAGNKERKKSFPLYLFCLRKTPFLFTRPKLYLYPLKTLFLNFGKK